MFAQSTMMMRMGFCKYVLHSYLDLKNKDCKNISLASQRTAGQLLFHARWLKMLNKKLRKSPQCNRALSKYFLHCTDKYFHTYKESLSQTRWLIICRRKSGRGRQRLNGRSLSKVATGGQISLAVPTSFWFVALSLTVSLSL